MSQRVTLARLEAIVKRINIMTHSPLESWSRSPDGKCIAKIGNYHLYGAYGGWALHRMQSPGGGIEDVLQCGYQSKRELERLLFAFIRGLEVKS
jgi:hypothetical protein